MTKTEETTESIKYGGLSNSEIMIVYYRFKRYDRKQAGENIYRRNGGFQGCF